MTDEEAHARTIALVDRVNDLLDDEACTIADDLKRPDMAFANVLSALTVVVATQIVSWGVPPQVFAERVLDTVKRVLAQDPTLAGFKLLDLGLAK